MTLPDQLTIARALSVPVVVVLFEWNFPGHDYWATGVFIAAMSTDWFDGRIARRRGHISSLGTLLDPVADKLLVLSVLIVLIDQGVFPGWMVVAIVAREFLVSGLRLAALERGVVIPARDLGKLKTWSQAVAAAVGGFAAAGAWSDTSGVVGVARRARADLGLRPRLRPRRPRSPPQARRRVGLPGPTRARRCRTLPAGRLPRRVRRGSRAAPRRSARA